MFARRIHIERLFTHEIWKILREKERRREEENRKKRSRREEEENTLAYIHFEELVKAARPVELSTE